MVFICWINGLALADSAILGLGLIFYGLCSLVYVLRAYEKSEQELRLKYVFSLQLIPFTILFLLNLVYLNHLKRSITLIPILIFLAYDFWYRAMTEKKPLHHPDKWPWELIIYLLLLFAGSIGVNWYGYLVSEQHGRILVAAFFTMIATYSFYQIRYNRRKKEVNLSI